MDTTTYSLANKSDIDLLAELRNVIRRGNEQEAELLGYLSEVDARRLYVEQAASSMFVWCVERLGFSEDVAYKRIQACRAARRFPLIFSLVERGELHLAAVNLLAPHLTENNHAELCEAARGKSKRDVEKLVVTYFPKPDAATLLRKLPDKTSPAASVAPSTNALTLPARPSKDGSIAVPNSGSVAPLPQQGEKEPPRTSCQPNSQRATVAPLSADRYRLQVTLDEKTRNKLLRAQELLRHKLPDGDLAAVLDLALSQLCTSLEAKKFATLRKPAAATEVAPIHDAPEPTLETSQGTAVDCSFEPAPGQVEPKRVAALASPAPSENKPTRSRYIARAVRREAAARDGYQCSFVAADGTRCQARGKLEYHHLKPFARGGAATADNIALRCFLHNQHAAVEDFGKEHVERAIRQGRLGPMLDESSKNRMV